MSQPSQPALPQSGYTAAQLALALGLNKRSILKALVQTPPTGVAIVRGNDTPTWTLTDLPDRLIELLRYRAGKTGEALPQYLDGLVKLKERGIAPWQPKLSLAEIAADCLAEATKLRAALLPALQRHSSPLLSGEDRARLGLADYQRAFGHTINERHWRRLIARTLQRDGGAEDFNRLELYLPDNPKPKADPARLLPHEADFKELRARVQSFANPDKPSAAEKSLLWADVCELFSDIKTKAQHRKLRRQVVKFLMRHGRGLARNANALRVNLSRKLEAWQASDGDFNELVDGRADGSRAGFVLPEKDRLMLIASAALFGGGMQMAWRECYEQLSEETCKHYPNKRFCPRKVRESIRAAVKLEKEALKGPKNVRVKGAFVNRDPDGIAPGDWDQCDDMTPVNYWWEESETDPRGFWFGQGQWLPWIDERSWFIYDHTLVSDPYYDGFNIRNSWTKKAAEWGLPRQGLSLERGIWKRSRQLVGRKDDLDPSETETGLKRLGLRFHHFTEARGKVIERAFAELQNYFQAAPGYVGRVQMIDRYEGVQKKIALVKSGKAHPADVGFLHKTQLAQVFTTVCREFNERPMHGKYHLGLSPRQVFQERFTSKVIHVPKEFRWILASNRIVCTVGGNGISFDFKPLKGIYFKAAELGGKFGERIAAYFNPERPDTVFCTDLDGSNPFIAERAQAVAPHDPAPGTLERALAQNAAQNQFRRELHRSLRPYYNTPFFQNMFRPGFYNAEAARNSEHFAQEHNRIEAAQKAQTAQTNKARRAYSKLGMNIPSRMRPGAADAAAELAKLMAQPDQNPKSDTAGKKTYILKPFTGNKSHE
jgi:hypothetical protein